MSIVTGLFSHQLILLNLYGVLSHKRIFDINLHRLVLTFKFLTEVS